VSLDEKLASIAGRNLHSSVRKDEIDLELKRKEREIRETVGIYNQQVSELEGKLEQETKSKDPLQSKISQLQSSVDNFDIRK
jgi:CII-binding regulator of phage lambda lysogenization HflD